MENNLSLSHATHNSCNYYILLIQETIFSFTHSAFLTINSLISSFLFVSFFSLLTPSLSPPMASSLPTDFSLYLPLFSFFSLFLPFNTVLFLLTDQSTILLQFLVFSNYLYWISLPVKLFGLCGILNYLK